eukprot:m.82299 g.82299  ORF g.82299 m.82299 type:complete len:237 (-) comp21042_c0_seq4:65-775(-)
MPKCKIEVSHVVERLAKERTENDTYSHEFTLSARLLHTDGPQIEKIEFLLGNTFPEPVRVVTSPPFSTTAKGFGVEFELLVKIWLTGNTGPIDMLYYLSYPPPEKQSKKFKQVKNLSFGEPVASKKEPGPRPGRRKNRKGSGQLNAKKPSEPVVDPSQIENLRTLHAQLQSLPEEARPKIQAIVKEAGLLIHNEANGGVETVQFNISEMDHETLDKIHDYVTSFLQTRSAALAPKR